MESYNDADSPPPSPSEDYTYDDEGNMLTKTKISNGEVTTNSWDYRNRLTHIVVKDAEEQYDVESADRRRRYVEDIDFHLLDVGPQSLFGEIESALVRPLDFASPHERVSRQHALRAAALSLEREEAVPRSDIEY